MLLSGVAQSHNPVQFGLMVNIEKKSFFTFPYFTNQSTVQGLVSKCVLLVFQVYRNQTLKLTIIIAKYIIQFQILLCYIYVYMVCSKYGPNLSFIFETKSNFWLVYPIQNFEHSTVTLVFGILWPPCKNKVEIVLRSGFNFSFMF